MAPWLRARVEATARELAAEWDVELGPPFELSRFAFAAPAGTDAVLKLTPPEDEEGDHEADAMELWAAHGGLRVLRRDRARRAMLLERARPGHDASALEDDEAVAAALAVGRRIWLPARAPFRPAHELASRWLAATTDHPLHELALDAHERLGRPAHTLVHGDYHHHNLLRHGDRWVPIDPKPLLAEPEFDVPPFLWNPIPYLMTPERTERRIAAFVRGGLDEWRIRAWTVVLGSCLGAYAAESEVIAAVWTRGGS
jgi:streptomycin 6-kinase